MCLARREGGFNGTLLRRTAAGSVGLLLNLKVPRFVCASAVPLPRITERGLAQQIQRSRASNYKNSCSSMMACADRTYMLNTNAQRHAYFGDLWFELCCRIYKYRVLVLVAGCRMRECLYLRLLNFFKKSFARRRLQPPTNYKLWRGPFLAK